MCLSQKEIEKQEKNFNQTIAEKCYSYKEYNISALICYCSKNLCNGDNGTNFENYLKYNMNIISLSFLILLIIYFYWDL